MSFISTSVEEAVVTGVADGTNSVAGVATGVETAAVVEVVEDEDTDVTAGLDDAGAEEDSAIDVAVAVGAALALLSSCCGCCPDCWDCG